MGAALSRRGRRVPPGMAPAGKAGEQAAIQARRVAAQQGYDCCSPVQPQPPAQHGPGLSCPRCSFPP